MVVGCQLLVVGGWRFSFGQFGCASGEFKVPTSDDFSFDVGLSDTKLHKITFKGKTPSPDGSGILFCTLRAGAI